MNSRRTNLIPYSWQIVEKVQFKKSIILLALACSVVLFSLHLLQTIRIEQYRGEIRKYRSLQEEINYKQIEIENMKSDLNLILTKKEDLKKRVEFIETVWTEKVGWTELLRKLSFLIPDRVWLSELSVSQSSLNEKDESKANLQKINIVGSSLKDESVSKFVRALEESPDFAEVELSYVTKEDVGKNEVFDFEISLKFKGEKNELQR